MSNNTLKVIFSSFMILSLAACGNKEKEPDPVPTPEETEVPEEQETPEPEPETTEEPESTGIELQHGEVSGQVYQNESLNLVIDLPEGWTFMDDAQLAEINKQTGETMNSDFARNMLENGLTVIDAYAYDMSLPATINVVVSQSDQDVTTGNTELLYSMSESTLRKEFESQGYTDIEITGLDVNFMGETHPCLKSTVTQQDQQLYYRQVYCYTGKYLYVITIVTLGADHTEELFPYFTHIN
ncbi:MAG: hypothetical protein IKG15_05745 [Solobacterium sp.]|nr:hypothetical protein [Solobacterium sp.]